MKFHQFQQKIQAERPVVKLRYRLHGNIARFYIEEYDSEQTMHIDMQEALLKNLDVHLYNATGKELIFGSLCNGKHKPWRKKLIQGYGYYETLHKALEA